MSTNPIVAGGGPAPALTRRRHMPMTGWYNPIMLLQTGIRVLVSTIFGEFADRREIIAVANAFEPQPFDSSFDYSEKATGGEFWFDYVADTGDGWDPTLAIARLLTEPALELDGVSLPRGRVLIMGGDEVYPTPSRQAYEDHLIGPFEEAFSRLTSAARRMMPDLYVTPGNHDWYDGLSSFLALFCRRRIANLNAAGVDRPGRKIAGRETFQTRSYFALKLPHNWWLWGTDSQIEGYLDQPQVDFFQFVASNWMAPGSRVILCCGQPSWAYADARAPQNAFTTFSYLERLPGIAKSKAGKLMGHELKLVLTGDSHHYSRFSEDGAVQYITAGGGGAFLHPTHHLSDRKFLWDYPAPGQPKKKSNAYIRHFHLQDKIGATGEALFPDRSTSRSLTIRNLSFAFLNPGMLLFYWIAYTLFFWTLEASSVIATQETLGSYIGKQPNFCTALFEQLAIGFATPWPMLLFVASMLTYGYFTDEPHAPARRWIIGLTHGLVQATIVVTISCSAFWLASKFGAPSLLWRDVAPIVVGSMVAALASATFFGCYLWLALNVLGIHWNEAFSSLRIKDFKNFLRIRIGRDGALEVYPIGLTKVPRGDNGGAALAAHIIEGPITIRPKTAAAAKAQ